MSGTDILSYESPTPMARSLVALGLRFLPFAALLAMAFVYGLFGSPTPDTIGRKEILMMLGFVVAVGFEGVRGALAPLKNQALPDPLWLWIGRALLFYGVGFGVVNGLFSGNSLSLMFRDLAAFGLLLMPVFFWPHSIKAPCLMFFVCLISACGIGFMFSVRTLDWMPNLHNNVFFYLHNAPTVLFSALFLLSFGVTYLVKKTSTHAIFCGFILLVLATIPAIAMLDSLLRASVVALTIGAFSVFLCYSFARPLRVLLVFGLFWTFLTLGSLMIEKDTVNASIKMRFTHLIEKNENVGLNDRDEELFSVMKAIDKDPCTVLFGIGWGGTFFSPAAGGVYANYTHSLLSAALLKIGVIGLILTIVYIFALMMTCLRVALSAPLLGMCLIIPLLINVFLYAAYKSFDFGLILTLIPASWAYIQTLVPTPKQPIP